MEMFEETFIDMLKTPLSYPQTIPMSDIPSLKKAKIVALLPYKMGTRLAKPIISAQMRYHPHLIPSQTAVVLTLSYIGTYG
jgi:16S rRNA A1518/A1519 N6-dimethyltransferase RsmA/KsgA/DIM1 with predicted DNA glycosylase/AP lyase activity